MSQCKQCGATSDSARFYASNRTLCAPCVIGRVRAYRLANIDRIREYDNARAFKEARVKARQAYAMAHRGEGRPRPVIAWKKNANERVNNAVRDKKIAKPKLCEACGRAEPLDAHHYDYSKPLDVVWVCKPCHGQIHRYENDRARRPVQGLTP